MAKEKKIGGNVISRQFTTMLPLDVIANLVKFAKENTLTGMGKYDFGVAIRILLNRAELEERISQLEDEIYLLQSKEKIQSTKQEVEPEVKTFGYN